MCILSKQVFLTSVTCISCISTVTLAVCLAQARHSTFAMFTARHTAGVGSILVLLITEYTSKTRLTATGVRVGVDWKAGTMDTPEDGETGKMKMWTDIQIFGVFGSCTKTWCSLCTVIP